MTIFRPLATLACISALLICIASCSDRDLKPIKVELGTRSISKLPFMIALDQGLYEKYGLAIDLRLPAPAFEGGIHWQPDIITRISRRIDRARGRDDWAPDIYIDGHTPNIVKRIDRARWPHRIAIAGNDCLVRTHVIGSKDINSVEELRGKRLGISSRRDTTLGFAALSLSKRMGWDATQEISLKLEGRDVGALREGLVDAIVANEIRGAQAMQEGFPVLEDMQKWNIAVAGNSVMVEQGWLDDDLNRDIARRFLQATVEGLALFHSNRELALNVMAKWNGITDTDIATHAYERGQWMQKKPYPCYEGINNTFEMYDSNEMRKFKPTDFYDDSLLRELDESGFIDSFY
ncbi:MAG: ABC transporter substrate-binding protein [Woeseiaceae bacterium]